jgi:hypothetical protein
MEHKEVSMEHKQQAFDAHGFLDLLGEVMDHDVTGVLNVRIHVRDGVAWAVSVQFNTPQRGPHDRPARLPAALPTDVPMRLIGLAVILTLSLIAAPRAFQSTWEYARASRES